MLCYFSMKLSIPNGTQCGWRKVVKHKPNYTGGMWGGGHFSRNTNIPRLDNCVNNMLLTTTLIKTAILQ